MTTKNLKIILFLFITLYFVFSCFISRQLLVGDELRYLYSAKSIASQGIPANVDSLFFTYAHPPMVNYSHALTYILFNFLDVATAARLFGAFCFIVSLVMTFLISRNIESSEKGIGAGLLAASLFAVNPFAIRGSLLLAMDTCSLNVALLIFIYYFIKNLPSFAKLDYVILGILFCFALWNKITTSLALIPSIIIFFFVNKEFKKGILYSLLISAIGFGLFIASWLVYAHVFRVPSGIPFEYLIRWPFIRLAEGHYPLGRNLMMFLRSAATLILYNTVFFVILACLSVESRFRKYKLTKRLEALDFLVIYSTVICAAYLILGSLNYGFPIYHFPIIAPLAIVIASYTFPKLGGVGLKSASIIVILLIFYYLFVGDLLYWVSYKLKESFIYGRDSVGVISELTWRAILYMLPLAIFLFFRRPFLKQTILLLLLISASIGFNIIQAKSNYLTGYYYGDQGLREVVSFLDRNAKDSSEILGPSDTIYYFSKNKGYIFRQRDLLREFSPQHFLDELKQKNIKFVIASVSSLTITHFKYIFNESSVKRELDNNFALKRIGSYSIWVKDSSAK